MWSKRKITTSGRLWNCSTNVPCSRLQLMDASDSKQAPTFVFSFFMRCSFMCTSWSQWAECYWAGGFREHVQWATEHGRKLAGEKTCLTEQEMKWMKSQPNVQHLKNLDCWMKFCEFLSRFSRPWNPEPFPHTFIWRFSLLVQIKTTFQSE